MIKPFLLIIAFIGSLSISANAQKLMGDEILGTWIVGEGKARVTVFKQAGYYYGKLIWLKEPTKNGKPKVDMHNPDPKLRNKPVIDRIGLTIFEFDEDEWNHGNNY